ncbi:hypothetical protein [Streptomyces sp. NRRL S-237]|uniref:hypothetical protein n=1 Tax=Streptomyces sp. NRRL S-237 TaxID=1463895 RepID=UPI0004C5137B|nr:hypothetical protein [Streptomyces sp. NRRL S-237]
MDLEQLRASCEARVEALGLPHRFSTRDPLDGEESPPAAGTRSRRGDLPAETAWLPLVADAYRRRPAREHAGAAS